MSTAENGCSLKEQDGFQIVAVAGEVDLSWSGQVRRAILDALGTSDKVLVRMSEVSYIDSSGIAALVEGYQTAKAKSAIFGLLEVSAPVRAVLELARLDQVFPMHDSVADAAG